MRELLRDFADRAGTVLLSSHLLREVEVIADQLSSSATARSSPRAARRELLAATGTFVRARDPEALPTALVAAGIGATRRPTARFVADAEPEAVGVIAAELGCALSSSGPPTAAGSSSSS